jgi:hypothetical protein
MTVKRLWHKINSRYFTYVAVAFLCLLKLLFEDFKSSRLYLHYGLYAGYFAIGIYIIAIINILCLLLAVAIIDKRFNTSFNDWQQKNKATTIERFVNAFICSPAVISLAIICYGFYAYLVLFVFTTWYQAIIFFSAVLTVKTIKLLRHTNKKTLLKEMNGA